MKKITTLILLFTLSFSAISFAQDTEQAYKSKRDLFYVHLREANYDAMKALVPEIEKQYLNLSDADREKLKGYQAGVYYDFACLFSILKDADASFSYLKKAADMGWDNYRHMMSDGDLEFIRNDKRFAEISEPIREKGDYLGLLRKANPYQNEKENEYPPFEYESADSERLQQIKNYFNLDSIAGDGDEVSKIIKLMTWLHDGVRHDGNHWPQIDDYNAINIYEYANKNNKGVNCRALSIALNDCCLALGFASRFVICLPRNEYDSDCHVINSVYSPNLGKWLWMDPTNNAYVKDESGNLLSIAEVRERLINNMPLVLNEDANWNNQEKQTKEWYLESYMAKNLYAIQCPLRSEMNMERAGRSDKKYVILLPSDYHRVRSQNDYIKSNDAHYFWQVP